MNIILGLNNGCIVRLPKVKLEVARKGFYHMGAVTYNSLPIVIRNSSSLDEFKRKLAEHYSLL